MVEFKMAAIIKLSQNEWVKFFFQMVGREVWSEVFLVQMVGTNPGMCRVSLRGKTNIGWIQDGQIEDGCHHQVEWEWMSLSQIELVWVRVLCRMAESKIVEFKMGAIIKLIRLN